MLKEDRQKQIIDILWTKGRVEVEELCQMFTVTKMTIRRDLDELETEGLLIRSHGGALITEKDILVENPFHFRLSINTERKLAIAAGAVNLLYDGQKIFIGSGTTTHYLSQKIDNSRRLIIVTDAINIASELTTRSSISVIQVGGDIRPITCSATGVFAENMIRQFKFQNAFISVTGIGEDGQIYVGSIVQLSIYQAIFDSAGIIIILADTSKLGIEDFVCLGRLSEKYTLITNNDAPDFILESYRSLGTNIITV